MSKIKIQTANKEIVEVDMEMAKNSVLINNMLETLGLDNVEQEVISLPRVTSNNLKKVIEWIKFHHENPPLPDNDGSKARRIKAFETTFLSVDLNTLFELVSAADYLDVVSLLDIAAQKVANMMKEKSVEEIREIFKIENDMTPSLEEQLRQANAPCNHENHPKVKK